MGERTEQNTGCSFCSTSSFRSPSGIVEQVIRSPGVLGVLYGLAVLIPGIAVGVRRLHDTGRTGLWLLAGFIPVIGFILLLVFMVQDSEPGPNQYGPNPKGVY